VEGRFIAAAELRWRWFPRPRRFKQAVSVRWKRGRFARDTDLHNVVGLLALSLLVVWAYTGAGYATELMEKGWYAVTPGSAHPEVDAVSAKAEKGTPDITPREAADAAQARYPDLKLVNMDVPVKGDRTGAYTFYFQRGLDPWGNNDYPGNVGVFVDRHTGETGDFYGFADEAALIAYDIYLNRANAKDYAASNAGWPTRSG